MPVDLGPCLTRFDRTNPRAVEWARDRSSKLVREITRETRAAIRATIARAFEQGLPPRRAARLLRSVVGLTERQAGWVLDLEEAIANGNPGTLVKAGKTRVRIPKGGANSSFIQRASDRYAQRLHRARTLLIARTETIAASNQGQIMLWSQAVQRGELKSDTTREWITTPDDRLCPYCMAMDGQTRGLEEQFNSDLGSVDAPPLHPACRCAIGVSAP